MQSRVAEPKAAYVVAGGPVHIYINAKLKTRCGITVERPKNGIQSIVVGGSGLCQKCFISVKGRIDICSNCGQVRVMKHENLCGNCNYFRERRENRLRETNGGVRHE